jgi:hypothetical protein
MASTTVKAARMAGPLPLARLASIRMMFHCEARGSWIWGTSEYMTGSSPPLVTLALQESKEPPVGPEAQQEVTLQIERLLQKTKRTWAEQHFLPKT